MTVSLVHYRERQRLLSADLVAEQTFRLGIAGRHHLAPHQWGIVRGLGLAVGDDLWTLNPGVAIDGYGREIVVPAPFHFPAADDDACVAVILYYCEFPEQLQPVRCIEDPAPRIGHGFRVSLVPAPEFVALSGEPDVGRGRAAGGAKGLPPWPVLVGVAGRNCFDDPEEAPSPPIDYRPTRYVGHRAGGMRSPMGRAAMRVGPAGRKDVYDFLLSTRNDAGSMDKRIGVDRDRLVRVWRQLLIVGAEGEAEVQISAQASIRVEVPRSAGTAPRARLHAILDRRSAVLTTSLIEAGNTEPEVTVTRLRRDRRLSTELRFPSGRVAKVQLLVGGKTAPPFVRPLGAPRGPRSEPVFESFFIETQPVGGVLVIQPPDAVVEERAAPACGDVSRVRETQAVVRPHAVQFRAGARITPNPVMREIHAVRIESADLVPRTELRVSGGPADDQDPYPRMAVGDRRPGAWSPALSMNGWGKLVIGRDPAANTAPQAVLRVQGTVYLPPVGKDDPLLSDLMGQAFIAGLLQMGQVSAEVDLKASAVPASIVNTEGFKYTLTARRHAGAQLVKIKRCTEMITAVEGGGGAVPGTIQGLPAELTDFADHSVEVLHPAFTIAATKIRITIQLLIGIGSATRVVQTETPVITVTEPTP